MTDTGRPSPEQLAKAMEVARAGAEAAENAETDAEKTAAAQDAIEQTALKQFPELSDQDAKRLAAQLAPMMVGPVTDGLIEQMRQLEVVFTPGQTTPTDPGTPEDAARIEAETPVGDVEPPRRRSFAERFAGR